MRKLLSLVVVFILASTLVYLTEPQCSPYKQYAQTETKLKKINITGKIIKEPDGYFIQGKVPSEIFRILNSNPKRLDKIVKSGQVVNIEASIVQGDNVTIEKINGQRYKKEQQPRSNSQSY